MVKRMAVGALVMVLVVLAVGLGLVTASRMRAPSAEQQAALALLKQKPPTGSNAYPALLLMPYDVPASEVEALALAQAERFNRTPAGTPGFQLEGPYARSAPASGEPGNCSWSEGRCLEKVRGNRDAFAGRIASQQALLQRIGNLSRHSHYRCVMDARPDATFPEFQVVNASTTSHALQFVDGNVASALAGVCGDVRTWRTLAPNADSLVASMIGGAIIQGSSQLFAGMLESLPADHPIPASCAAAFTAPAAAELSLCEAARGEAAMARSYSQTQWAEQKRTMTPLQQMGPRGVRPAQDRSVAGSGAGLAVHVAGTRHGGAGRAGTAHGHAPVAA